MSQLKGRILLLVFALLSAGTSRGDPPDDLPGEPLPGGALVRMGTLHLRPRSSSVDNVAALSPDLDRLAWIGTDSRLHLWETARPREVWQRPYPEMPVPGSNYTCEGVAFSPDGKTLAGTGKRLCLWDSATGKELWRSRVYPSGCGWATFSPDGKLLAVFAHGTGVVSLWDVATRKELQELGRQSMLTRALAFSPDGKVLAVAGTDRPIEGWEADTGKPVFRFGDNNTRIQKLAFSPDGKLLAAQGYYGRLHLWDLAAGKEVRIREGTADLTFSPDGRTLVWSSWRGYDTFKTTLHLEETATGKELGRLELPGPGLATRFSRDGKLLAVVGRGELRTWEVATRKEIVHHTFAGHVFRVTRLAFSPDRKMLASASYPWEPVCLWDASTGKLRRQFQPGGDGSVHAIGFAADGKLLVVGRLKDSLAVWDAATGKQLLRLGEVPEKAEINVALSPDGKWLALQKGRLDTSGKIQLWDVPAGKEANQLGEKKLGSLDLLAFSPDSTRLAATGVFTPELFVWDVPSGLELSRFKPPAPGEGWHLHFNGLTFSGDSRLLASQTLMDRKIQLWGALPGREAAAIECRQEVGTFRFSPDDRVLAVAEGKVIVLWELATGKERCRLAGHVQPVTALAFSSDGKTLVSGSDDTTILVWDLTGRKAEGKPGIAALSPKEREALGEDLAREAPRACRAMQTLLAGPAGDAVPFLTERLEDLDRMKGRIEQMIRDLDDDAFAVREKASTDLAGLGSVVKARLLQVLKDKPSPEVRRRVTDLLMSMPTKAKTGPFPHELAAIRAIEVLERLGTPEARRVLEKLARGAADDIRTREAKASLKRLARRAKGS